VNRQNGIVFAQGSATVDDFLNAALDFRVAALHRGEIQILMGTARRHAGGCAAAQPNQHRRSAQNHNRSSGGEGGFMHVRFPDIAQTAGDHDRFVIAAPLPIGTIGSSKVRK
jgi:hypothetical protein